MPEGMKWHLEYELFPHIQLKVGKGICVSTACCWMLQNSFHYMQYKKALYFDGHECPNVIDYCQNVFLPPMAEFWDHLVEYKLDNIFEEVIKDWPLGVHKLILCPHDESTMQSKDGQKAEWGPENEMPLLKKGVGQGSQWNDVICSTVGWLQNAGQQLKYGKNYNGYWTGELFVKQVWSFEWQSWLKWILLLKLTNHNRLRKKSYLPSRSCTYPQSIKHYFLLIIHKATLLILLMPFWSPAWILVLEEQNHVCKMDGTCEMDRRLLSKWPFLKIIPPILVSQKE